MGQYRCVQAIERQSCSCIFCRSCRISLCNKQYTGSLWPQVSMHLHLQSVCDYLLILMFRASLILEWDLDKFNMPSRADRRRSSANSSCGNFEAVAFEPNGKYLIATAWNSWFLWDLESLRANGIPSRYGRHSYVCQAQHPKSSRCKLTSPDPVWYRPFQMLIASSQRWKICSTARPIPWKPMHLHRHVTARHRLQVQAGKSTEIWNNSGLSILRLDGISYRKVSSLEQELSSLLPITTMRTRQYSRSDVWSG